MGTTSDRFGGIFVVLETVLLPLLEDIAVKILKGKVYNTGSVSKLVRVCQRIVDAADHVFDRVVEPATPAASIPQREIDQN